MLRRLPAGLPPLAILLAITAIGLLILAPLYVWEFVTVGGFAVTLANILSIAYVALFASVSRLHLLEPRGGRGGRQQGRPVLPPDAGVLDPARDRVPGRRAQPFHFAGIVLIGLGLYLTTTARATPGNFRLIQRRLTAPTKSLRPSWRSRRSRSAARIAHPGHELSTTRLTTM